MGGRGEAVVRGGEADQEKSSLGMGPPAVGQIQLLSLRKPWTISPGN